MAFICFILLWQNAIKANRKHIFFSDLLPATVVVPQGAILSPILFSIFINSIVTFLNNYEMMIYANDTTALVIDDVKNVQNNN